ncbi:MAG: type I secretion system permease/ATPase [Solirubrobacterales bacterium]
MKPMGKDGILAGARPTLAAAALFSLFANVLILAVPLYSLQVYDRVLASRSGMTLVMLTVVAVGALAVHATLEAARSRLMVHIGMWLDRSWAPALLERAIRKAPGEPVPGAMMLRDLATLRGFIAGSGIFHLFDAPWVPIYMVVMFILHPALGWMTTIGAAVLFGLALVSELLTGKALKEGGRELAIQLQLADALVRHAEVIESMGMLPGIRDMWSAEARRTQTKMSEGWHRSAWLGAIARFLRFGVQVAVIATGAYLAVTDQLTAGSVVAGSILLSRALAPVESLVGSWKGFVTARAALARINEELADTSGPRRTVTRLPTPKGALSVERVSLEVEGRERKVLDEIEFAMAPGEAMGIIGPSAAGKSTLARVILGLQAPSSGTARLDGADVATWAREDIGTHLGYVPQGVELFPGTVRENIARMGTPDDDLVIEAATLAGVHDMILRLPLGYDTEIGEATRNLSGGQRQRLAIARAFYGSPRLIVLDEPNSNLDAEGENAVIRALLRARERGVSVIVIAHRARVLMTVDRLLLLREGKVEMLGARDEVMARVLPPNPQPAPHLEQGAALREVQS